MEVDELRSWSSFQRQYRITKHVNRKSSGKLIISTIYTVIKIFYCNTMIEGFHWRHQASLRSNIASKTSKRAATAWIDLNLLDAVRNCHWYIGLTLTLSPNILLCTMWTFSQRLPIPRHRQLPCVDPSPFTTDDKKVYRSLEAVCVWLGERSRSNTGGLAWESLYLWQLCSLLLKLTCDIDQLKRIPTRCCHLLLWK